LERNGVEKPPRRAFPLRLVSSEIPGRIELVIATIVVATVFGVAFLIFNLPGPLVVHVHDEAGGNVMGARVSCEDAAGLHHFSGITDVFGETKWPGLEKVLWSCRILPPDRFQLLEQYGTTTVRSRSPATVEVRIERPLHVNVTVKRPKGSPRARPAVRAICPATQTAPEMAWEARASVLTGNTELWLPFGRACRAGLAQPQLTERPAGLVPNPTLDCSAFPCTPIFSGASAKSLDFTLEPTDLQWANAKPPPDPEADLDGGVR
jgi:hypothetical protein